MSIKYQNLSSIEPPLLHLSLKASTWQVPTDRLGTRQQLCSGSPKLLAGISFCDPCSLLLQQIRILQPKPIRPASKPPAVKLNVGPGPASRQTFLAGSIGTAFVFPKQPHPQLVTFLNTPPQGAPSFKRREKYTHPHSQIATLLELDCFMAPSCSTKAMGLDCDDPVFAKPPM